MTGKEFADYIRFMTRTNTTTFSDANLLLLANVSRDELSQQVMDAQEDIFLIPHTTDLLLNERLYPFPSSILSRMKKCEAKFDGTNWIPLLELDLSQYSETTDETTITENFANEKGKAKYEIGRKALRIFSGSIIAVEDGLKLWCSTYPAKLQTYQFSDTEVDLSVDPSPTEHGFPREFHELWARRISILYKTSREKPIALSEQELRYDVDLRTALNTLRHGNDDREVIAQVPGVDTDQPERWVSQNGQNL